VFVNASPKQLGTASLAKLLESAVSEADVSAERVCVEVTESGMIRTSRAADGDLDGVHELGHPVVLDDFGMGSGALATILDKPVSGIKLSDRFTRRLGDGAAGDKMSRGIALLANDLGLMAGIKGIETEDQLGIARGHGWKMGQGYLFGKAVAEAELGLS